MHKFLVLFLFYFCCLSCGKHESDDPKQPQADKTLDATKLRSGSGQLDPSFGQKGRLLVDSKPSSLSPLIDGGWLYNTSKDVLRILEDGSVKPYADCARDELPPPCTTQYSKEIRSCHYFQGPDGTIHKNVSIYSRSPDGRNRSAYWHFAGQCFTLDAPSNWDVSISHASVHELPDGAVLGFNRLSDGALGGPPDRTKGIVMMTSTGESNSSEFYDSMNGRFSFLSTSPDSGAIALSSSDGLVSISKFLDNLIDSPGDSALKTLEKPDGIHNLSYDQMRFNKKGDRLLIPIKAFDEQILASFDLEGHLDKRFGDRGVIRGLSGSFDLDNAFFQDNGDMIIADKEKTIRIKSNGHIDPSFGGGKKVPPLTLRQSDGKYIATSPCDRTVTISRYDANGMIDKSFGENGSTRVIIVKGQEPKNNERKQEGTFCKILLDRKDRVLAIYSSNRTDMIRLLN